jgi:ketosteroid isomerase-like protein
MRTLLSMIMIAPLASLLVACGGGSDAEDAAANEAGAEKAHVAYVAAINSNDLAQFNATITDDIVYLPPNSPALVGRAAVSEFAKGYFEAYQTVWVKTSVEFTVRDDLAYERYTYKSVDTPRPGGPAAGTPVVTDTGNGINIYQRGADGKWRVARDGWATDTALAAN